MKVTKSGNIRRNRATQAYLDELAEKKAAKTGKHRSAKKAAPPPNGTNGAKAAPQFATQFSAADIAKMKEVLQDDVKASGIDPDVLQVIMAAVREMAIELRRPSPEEEEKKKLERERQMQNRLQAAEDGKRIKATIAAEQASCGHVKPNGMHTFGGQVYSDGWAVIKCVRCMLAFRVRPLPQHVSQGLQLEQIRGLTVDHLQRWSEQSPIIDKRIRESEANLQQMNKELADAQLQV